MSIPLRYAVAIVAALSGSAAAQAQQTVFPPGSGIGLVPPKGMSPASGFAGFEDRANGASILMADMPPQAYPEILAGFTPEALAPTGFLAGAPAVEWPVKGGEGRMLRGRQTAQGVVYRKWIVLAKAPNGTAMISAQAPEMRAKELPDAAIEAALRTVALRTPPSLDEQAAALPFTLGDKAGFRIVRVLAGSGILLTEGVQDIVPDASQPVVVVASALGAPVEPSNRAAFARQAFDVIGGVSDLVVDKESASDRGGASGIRLEGRGVYRSSGEAVYVVQVLRFTAAGYVRIVAISRSLERERYEARFTRLAESVGPR